MTKVTIKVTKSDNSDNKSDKSDKYNNIVMTKIDNNNIDIYKMKTIMNMT